MADDRLAEQIAALERKLAGLEERLAENQQKTTWDITGGLDWLRGHLMREVDRTRSRRDVPDADLVKLAAYRRSPEYATLFKNPRPLVSVVISTYNRAQLLVERSLDSVLRQDYDRIEAIVVDDASTDDTERRVRALGDARITFVRMIDHSLPKELSAGVEARNLGLAMATGDFITHLDDDDEFTTDRVGKLLSFAQQERAEFVWHPFWWQEVAGQEWAINDAPTMELANATTGSVFYIGWLKRYPWDPLSVLRYEQPDDWALFRLLRDMGVVMKRYPEPLLRHYKEGQNPRWSESASSPSGNDQPAQ